MPFMSKIKKRVDMPDGGWVDVHMPSYYHRSQVEDWTKDWPELVLSCIDGWSYEEPIDLEHVRDLDAESVNVLVAAIITERSEEEEKKDTSSSTVPSKAKAPRRESGS